MPSEDAAIAAWNRRAPAALPTREEMAEALIDVVYDEERLPAADAILSLLRAKEAEG